MSTSYLVSVPKLKGRENYNEWCFAAENFLILEGMWHCVKPEAGKVVEAADDEKTKAKLIMTIDPSLFVHVRDVKSSKSLWEKLKNLFDDSGFSRRISLLRNLISIRQEDCSSMTNYVTQIIDTAQKLQGTGFMINEEWIGSLLLAGLPDRFSPMIMAIEHSGISITSDAIKTKLIDMESTDVNEVDSAFATRSKYHKFQKNKMMTLTGNDNKDHMSGMKSSSNIKCYRCKQPGHYRNKCPNNDNDKSHNSSNAFSAVFLTGSFNKNEWYLDSGASVHLTANEDWIMNASYRKQKKIVIANNKKVPVLCSGDVKITTTTDSCEYDITVKDVFCVPSLTTNLLSVSQLIKKGNSVSFTDSGCSIYNKKNVLVATALLVNGVYKVNTSQYERHRRLGRENNDGGTLMIHVAKEKRKKWDKNSEKDYPENSKGYREYNSGKKVFLTSREIVLGKESKYDCQMHDEEKNFDSVGDDKRKDSISSPVLSDRVNSDETGEIDGPEKERWKPTMKDELLRKDALQTFDDYDACELMKASEDSTNTQYVLRKTYDIYKRLCGSYHTCKSVYTKFVRG